MEAPLKEREPAPSAWRRRQMTAPHRRMLRGSLQPFGGVPQRRGGASIDLARPPGARRRSRAIWRCSQRFGRVSGTQARPPAARRSYGSARMNEAEVSSFITAWVPLLDFLEGFKGCRLEGFFLYRAVQKGPSAKIRRLTTFARLSRLQLANLKPANLFYRRPCNQ